jgi:hypothetical protein
MDVVWHDAPGNDAISISVEVKQRLLHKRRDTLVAQPTGAVASIFVFVDPFAESNLTRINRREIFYPRQLSLPLVYHRFGNCIMEAERDGLY